MFMVPWSTDPVIAAGACVRIVFKMNGRVMRRCRYRLAFWTHAFGTRDGVKPSFHLM
jgi:hypothetical protein